MIPVDELVGIVSRVIVVVFYLAAFVAAASALRVSTMWSRRVSATAIGIISAVWIVFYLLIVDWEPHSLTSGTAWSRVAGAITAMGLFTMANMIARSERYGVRAVAAWNGDDE